MKSQRIQTKRLSVRALLLAAAGLLAVPVSGAIQVETPLARLTVDDQGLSLAPGEAGCPAIAATGAPLWRLVLRTAAGEITLSSAGQKREQKEIAGGVRFVYETVSDGSSTWKIRLALDVRRNQDGFELGGELRNECDGVIVAGFDLTALAGIEAAPETYRLLWPNGLGQRLVPGGKAGERAFAYPGRTGTMQWCAFAGAQGGLYVGCHDASHGAKTFASRFDAQTRRSTLEIRHQPFCASGTHWSFPPAIILPYRGTWHNAARYYRSWFDSVQALQPPPEWVREASGWLLCILKQQNGSVMWDYPSLGELAGIAGQRGLDVLGLFGWAEGGHDHLYPDYHPSPDMGGADALRGALKQVRQLGKRSIIYANGQLMDIATDYYRTQGKDQAVLREDGSPVRQDWQKFRSFPPVKCALACQAANGWQQRMLELACQAQELGADGILFDQLGVTGPMTCWAQNHGHPAPAMVYAGERAKWVREVADAMKRRAPGFIVMTEGIHDSVLDSVAMFHGCMVGAFTPAEKELQGRLDGTAAEVVFPELFRYTFPEVLMTQRHPTPMLSRLAANYACVYGLRFEIESRYAPDVRYLKTGELPQKADYADVLNPPDVAMMNGTPAAESVRYLSQLAAFQKRFAPLLRKGRFEDDRGFVLTGEGLIAKAYSGGDQLGVLVWNLGQEPAEFTLVVPGGSLVTAAEPERDGVEPGSALPAQSVRLVVWQRDTGAGEPAGPAKVR